MSFEIDTTKDVCGGGTAKGCGHLRKRHVSYANGLYQCCDGACNCKGFVEYLGEATSVADMDQRGAREAVNHPQHYGGADNPYEAIKVIYAWQLNFSLGSAVKYIKRAGLKDSTVLGQIEDLEKAARYIKFEIDELKKQFEIKGSNNRTAIKISK